MSSIVDYLKSQGSDSSYSARKDLAQSLGISNYSGTAEQNTQMLKMLKSGNSSANTTKATSSTSVVNGSPINGVDADTYNKMKSTYSQSSAVTNAQNEANKYLDKVKEISSVTDIIDQSTWDAINTPFASSSAYQEAMNYTNGLLQQLSSGRTSYTDQIKDLMGQIQNRDDFEYDVDADPLFQQALASAMSSGKTAMQDTIGQASALTGGYGSTYATTAGNQAYNAYIQDAYNNLPEYYQMALEAYQMEGEEMYRQLGMLQEADATEYQRMYDSWSANFANTQNMYSQEYGQWQDSINNAYNSASLQLNEHGQLYQEAYNTYTAVQNNADTMYAQEYQKWADEVSNAFNLASMGNSDYWNTTNYNESVRQFNEQLAQRQREHNAEMGYKYKALEQDQAQFDASLDYKINNGGGDSDDDSNKTLTARELDTVKYVYREAGGANSEDAFEKVHAYLESIGKSEADVVELDKIIAEVDAEMAEELANAPVWEKDWTILDDTKNGGFLWWKGADHNDTFKNGNDVYTYDQLKDMIKDAPLSEEEKEEFLNKLTGQSTK